MSGTTRFLLPGQDSGSDGSSPVPDAPGTEPFGGLVPMSAGVGPTRGRSATDGEGSSGPDLPLPERHRFTLSARARILVWVLFAMVLALATVGITLGAVLLNRVETEATSSVEQEINEFTQFAARGVDPASGESFTTTGALLRTHLQAQYPDENEVLFGYTDILIRQARQAAGDPAGDRFVVREIIDSPDSFGTVETAGGEMLWVKQTVRTAAGGTPAIFVVGHLLDGQRDEVNTTIRLITLVSVVALVFSSLVAWVVAGRILEPIRLVRQTAAAITEKRLNQRIPVRGKDDIAALSSSFNAMLDRLDSAFIAQRQFVDDASHELRTPITIVRGHLEVMGDDPLDRADTLRIVIDELDRMNRIVDDLLVLARSEQPDFVRVRECSMADLTATVDAKVRALGDRRWVLESVADGEVAVDPQRVTQAVVQLAQNAVQHTGSGDSIRIGSALRPGLASFWVSDSGPGVPAADLDTIFERFSRGSTGGAQSHSVGAGLGLSIVRAIAVAHGGQAWALNNAEGGATFGIDLPLPTAEQSAPGTHRSLPEGRT